MLYSVDIETTGLDSFKDEILCIGVYREETGYRSFLTLKEFEEWSWPDHEYIFHQGSFDVNFLRRKGFNISKLFAYDTKSIATTLIPKPISMGLEALAIDLLKEESYKLDRTKMVSYSQSELLAYNQKDCEIAWKLFHYELNHLDPKDWQFVEDWLMPATKLCMEMEYEGVYCDRSGLEIYLKETEAKLEDSRKRLYSLTDEARFQWKLREVEALKAHYLEAAERAKKRLKDPSTADRRYSALFERAEKKIPSFNFNSQPQLKWLLKEYYGLNLLHKRTEKETTDENLLKQYSSQHEICRLLLEYREYDKLVSTCIPALLDHIKSDDRIHSHFRIGGARTGRLSSSSPNMQNVPRGKLRSYIIASEGHDLLVADYAQLEPRVLAHLAGETRLIETFKTGLDLYSVLAKDLFKLDCEVKDLKKLHPKHRDVAKTVGLSILYGTGPYRLVEVLEKELNLKMSYMEAKSFIEDYRESFPEIVAYKRLIERRMANCQKVYNLLGRPLYIETNEELYMKAMNTVVQGSASDLVIRAACNIRKACPEIKPIMLIHDEFVFEVPKDFDRERELEALATSDLEQSLNLSVPLKIEMIRGREWVKP